MKLCDVMLLLLTWYWPAKAQQNGSIPLVCREPAPKKCIA
jgi:hypothetical protein